jgi:hypothetical protein
MLVFTAGGRVGALEIARFQLLVFDQAIPFVKNKQPGPGFFYVTHPLPSCFTNLMQPLWTGKGAACAPCRTACRTARMEGVALLANLLLRLLMHVLILANTYVALMHVLTLACMCCPVLCCVLDPVLCWCRRAHPLPAGAGAGSCDRCARRRAARAARLAKGAYTADKAVSSCWQSLVHAQHSILTVSVLTGALAALVTLLLIELTGRFPRVSESLG